jgi:hypothetical protein
MLPQVKNVISGIHLEGKDILGVTEETIDSGCFFIWI